MRQTIHLLITGKVQGVSFRESLKILAEKREVTGWVRNRMDGSVEAVLQGTSSMLEEIVSWCEAGGPPSALVKKVETKAIEDRNIYLAFVRKESI